MYLCDACHRARAKGGTWSHVYRQVQDHTAKFSAWLFALTFFFTFLTAASAFAQEAPEITADAAIVVDADTGKTLFFDHTDPERVKWIIHAFDK